MAEFTKEWLSVKDLNDEIWTPVVGYEQEYEISSYGRVKSRERTLIRNNGRILNLNTRILSPVKNQDGYLNVSLRKGMKQKTFTINRLMAICFLGATTKDEVDHINSIRNDNRLKNLRIVSHKENCNSTHFVKKHSILARSKNGIGGKLKKRVAQISVNTGKIKNIYESINSASRFTAINFSHISKVCKGKLKTAGGYRWCYV